MPGYQDKQYTFVVSTIQTSILMLFNQSNSSEFLTYSQVSQLIQLAEGSDLNLALKYLCNPKCRVILKEYADKPEFNLDEKMHLA